MADASPRKRDETLANKEEHDNNEHSEKGITESEKAALSSNKDEHKHLIFDTGGDLATDLNGMIDTDQETSIGGE